VPLLGCYHFPPSPLQFISLSCLTSVQCMIVLRISGAQNRRGLDQGSSAWDKRKHLTSIKTKHTYGLNLELALNLALKNIRPRIEVLACQKQAQLSHYQVRIILIVGKIFNHIIFASLKFICSYINFTSYYYLINYFVCNLFNLFQM
jgi:hypothetical protein